VRSYEKRLQSIEDEIGQDLIELELEDGSELYVSSEDLVNGYVESVRWAAGSISKDDISERTLDIAEAKPGETKMSDLIGATLELAEDRNDIN